MIRGLNLLISSHFVSETTASSCCLGNIKLCASNLQARGSPVLLFAQDFVGLLLRRRKYHIIQPIHPGRGLRDVVHTLMPSIVVVQSLFCIGQHARREAEPCREDQYNRKAGSPSSRLMIAPIPHDDFRTLCWKCFFSMGQNYSGCKIRRGLVIFGAASTICLFS